MRTPAELLDLVGNPMGQPGSHAITQHQLNLFADATHDHQCT
ncbi:hypothetical protein [Micromonospora globispora]|nr:hypothetical protein [Micromonospora globispora]